MRSARNVALSRHITCRYCWIKDVYAASSSAFEVEAASLSLLSAAMEDRFAVVEEVDSVFCEGGAPMVIWAKDVSIFCCVRG